MILFRLSESSPYVQDHSGTTCAIAVSSPEWAKEWGNLVPFSCLRYQGAVDRGKRKLPSLSNFDEIAAAIELGCTIAVSTLK